MLRAIACALVGCLMLACTSERLPAPDRGRLRQPTGIAVSDDGTLLVVGNGNWDGAEQDGVVLLVDLPALHARLEDGECPDGDDAIPRCRISGLRLGEGVRVGTGLGNVVIDEPAGPGGRRRVLLPVRSPASIAWIDIAGGGEARLDCGHDDDGRCDDENYVTVARDDSELTFPAEPARIRIDDEGFRFLYVPHLLGARLSLLTLDGDRGPELLDVEEEFFLPRPDESEDFAGGFSVAQRPCDPMVPAAAARDCTRPLLYATHRFWPGLRGFTIAPGLDALISGGQVEIMSLDPALVQSRPYMGDAQFEDETGDRLLVVQTTPAALVRVDMSLDDEQRPVGIPRDTVPLCPNPNVMAIDRVGDEPGLALVTCYSEGKLAVVDLGTFEVVTILDVAPGANEIALDPMRRVAYVAATEDDSIAVVALDRLRPDYLQVRARVTN